MTLKIVNFAEDVVLETKTFLLKKNCINIKMQNYDFQDQNEMSRNLFCLSFKG